MTLLTNLLLLAFASAAQAAPTQEQTEPVEAVQPAPAEEAVETAEAAQPAAAETTNEKKICKYRRGRGVAGEKAGARVPMARVCRTKAEWDAEKSDKED